LYLENKYTDVELYYKMAEQLKLQDLECSYCGNSGCFKVHGKYSRYIVKWVKGSKVCSSIKMLRFHCENCKKTHAFLPAFILPYFSYELHFIMLVFMRYFQKRMTVLQICKKYDISESMLYLRVHRFEKCHNRRLDMLKVLNAENRQKNEWGIIQKLENALEFLFCIGWSDTFLSNYRLMFQKSFMNWGT